MNSNDLMINFGIFGIRIIRPLLMKVWVGPFLTRHFVITEGSGSMDINLGDNQFTNVHLQALDAANLAGQFVSPPQWTVDDPSIVTITPDAGGVNCRIEATSPAKLGTAVITVTDADDPNVPGLTFNVTVGAESTTHIGVVVDPPQEKDSGGGGTTPPPVPGPAPAPAPAPAPGP